MPASSQAGSCSALLSTPTTLRNPEANTSTRFLPDQVARKPVRSQKIASRGPIRRLWLSTTEHSKQQQWTQKYIKKSTLALCSSPRATILSLVLGGHMYSSAFVSNTHIALMLSTRCYTGSNVPASSKIRNTPDQRNPSIDVRARTAWPPYESWEL